MKEIISAFLAISILSVGGLGLYMYNNKDDVSSDDGDEKYNKHENYNENEELNYEIFEETKVEKNDMGYFDKAKLQQASEERDRKMRIALEIWNLSNPKKESDK
jgi:hypothetical protein